MFWCVGRVRRSEPESGFSSPLIRAIGGTPTVIRNPML
jgi:hypothetical protein